MRIIAGEKKGFKLYSIPGEKTRPTTDFVKEAMFSVIFDCEGTVVLDLYSGCGSLGFEALSRGASSADLVDVSSKAFRVMKKNIDKLEYNEYATIHCSKAETYLKVDDRKYDLIFADPPYNKNLVNSLIESVMESDKLSQDGYLIIEHSSKETIHNRWNDLIYKQKKYGHTLVTFICAAAS